MFETPPQVEPAMPLAGEKPSETDKGNQTLCQNTIFQKRNR